MTSGKRGAEQSHPAPYQSQSAAHHTRARHPPASPDNNSTRTRRQRPRKQREDRYEEEIQYNIEYFNARPEHRRAPQPPRILEEEYPPPPTYERATATAVSTLVSEDYVHESGPSLPAQAAIPVQSTPVIENRQHVDRSDSMSVNTVPPASQPEEDRSSIELVDLDAAARWEMERRNGVPLEERVKRHRMRIDESAKPASVPQRARLFSQPTTRRPAGMQFHSSQLSLRIPEDHDRYDDDRAQDNSDLSTPPTPKNPRLPHIPVSPSKFFHSRGQATQPSSSVISLIRNQSTFFKSTPSLLPTSPSHHGNHTRSRKLFNRKSKEREQLDDWEFLERTDSVDSSVDASTTTVDDDEQDILPNWENRSESRSTPRPGSSAGRTYDRTPRISSPDPPITSMYDHDPELPVVPCGPGMLPARSATERILAARLLRHLPVLQDHVILSTNAAKALSWAPIASDTTRVAVTYMDSRWADACATPPAGCSHSVGAGPTVSMDVFTDANTRKVGIAMHVVHSTLT
ncbi:hypothetical protein ID866_6951 [Astraeus odoratus]|nr:hypothetical protein ID866_6951 [Astraeus odoratus]